MVLREEEISKRGQRAITEMGGLPEMDDRESVLMEEYNRKLDMATKMIKDYDQARSVVNLHMENVKLGATLGYIK